VAPTVIVAGSPTFVRRLPRTHAGAPRRNVLVVVSYVLLTVLLTTLFDLLVRVVLS
jgi:hypothetical protein